MYKKIIKYIGALTSKPYAFKARPWELHTIETIDLFDALGSNIRVDIRGSDIMRILPITNEFINIEWISDKARYAYDGINKWRFISPMIKKNDVFISSSWKNVLTHINSVQNTRKFDTFIINTGPFTDLETVACLKKFSNQLNNVVLNTDSFLNADMQSMYTLNPSLFEASSSKVILLIGLNLRIDNPILNIRFKKLAQKKQILIISVGQKLNSNINFLHLGSNIITLKNLLQGKHYVITLINKFLKKTNFNKKLLSLLKNKISILVGDTLLPASLSLFKDLNFMHFNYFHFEIIKISRSIGQLQIYELNLINNNNRFISTKENNFIYLIGNESHTKFKSKDFTVFQGSHNVTARTHFNVILPTTTLYESSLLYINIFNFIQKTQSIIVPPKLVRSNWKTTKMLSLFFQLDIKFDNINQVHNYILNRLTPNIKKNISKYTLKKKRIIKLKTNKLIKIKLLIKNMVLTEDTFNYYSIYAIDKASKVMNFCSENIKNLNNFN